MNSSSETKLRKIERYSSFFRTVCTVLFVPVAIISVAATVSILAGWTAHIRYDGQTFVPSEMGLQSRVILAVAVLAAAAVAAKGLFHLRRLACNYTRREIFTIDSARQIRQFGVCCTMWGLIKVVWTFMPLVVSAHPPQNLSTTPDAVLIGLAIVGISWFAEMAAGLREENDLTI